MSRNRTFISTSLVPAKQPEDQTEPRPSKVHCEALRKQSMCIDGCIRSLSTIRTTKWFWRLSSILMKASNQTHVLSTSKSQTNLSTGFFFLRLNLSTGWCAASAYQKRHNVYNSSRCPHSWLFIKAPNCVCVMETLQLVVTNRHARSPCSD